MITCMYVYTLLLLSEEGLVLTELNNLKLCGCSCEMMLFIISVMNSRLQRQLIYNHSSYPASP